MWRVSVYPDRAAILFGEAKTELDHFGNCPICRALVDMRDLAQVMEHVQVKRSKS